MDSSSNHLGVIMAKIKERKTRVALTLPDSINQPLTELSKLLNQPKTAIITEMLTDVLPLVYESITAIKKMKEGQKDAVLNSLVDLIQTAENQRDQLQLAIDSEKEKDNG